jgi:hypothetical protein
VTLDFLSKGIWPGGDGQDVQLSNISLMAWARIKDVDAEIHGVIFVIKFHVSNAIKWIFVQNDQLENQKKNIENMILMAIPDNDHWIDLQNSSPATHLLTP